MELYCPITLNGVSIEVRLLVSSCKDITDNTKLLFLFHGSTRDASVLYNVVNDYTKKYNFIAVCFEFPRKDFDYSTYNLGGVKSSDTHYNSDTCMFHIVNDVYYYLCNILKRQFNGYTIYGFSAGCQFAHRLTMFENRNINSAIYAAAGWYTMDSKYEYPYGLNNFSDKPIYLNNIRRIPSIVCVGDKDNDPYGFNVKRSPEVDMFGINRFDRAISFARANNFEFISLDNIAHEEEKVLDSSLKEIYIKKILKRF